MRNGEMIRKTGDNLRMTSRNELRCSYKNMANGKNLKVCLHYRRNLLHRYLHYLHYQHKHLPLYQENLLLLFLQNPLNL